MAKHVATLDLPEGGIIATVLRKHGLDTGNTPPDLGTVLKRIREARDLSLCEAAVRSGYVPEKCRHLYSERDLRVRGLSRQTLNRLENGTAKRVTHKKFYNLKNLHIIGFKNLLLHAYLLSEEEITFVMQLYDCNRKRQIVAWYRLECRQKQSDMQALRAAFSTPF